MDTENTTIVVEADEPKKDNPIKRFGRAVRKNWKPILATGAGLAIGAVGTALVTARTHIKREDVTLFDKNEDGTYSIVEPDDVDLGATVEEE